MLIQIPEEFGVLAMINCFIFMFHIYLRVHMMLIHLVL